MLNHKLLTFFLFSVCVFQAYLIHEKWTAFETVSKFNEDSSTPTAGNGHSMTVSQPLKLETINAFKAVKERTLFSQDRKLPEKEKTVNPPPNPTPPARNPGFELFGVYLSSEEKIALIKIRSEKSLKSVRLEESYEGWTLRDLTEDSAILESHGQQITLMMEKNEETLTSPSSFEIDSLRK